jgi:hypothetical protein
MPVSVMLKAWMGPAGTVPDSAKTTIMDQLAMRDALDRDKSIIELRALLTSYEERLSRSSDTTPNSHAAQAHAPEPLFLVNDLAIDLRSSALDTCPVIEAPGIVDCFKPEESEPFSCVYKVTSGVYRVHPRQNQQTVAVIGPFGGPAPSGLIATAQITHNSGPPVRFHISLWPGEVGAGIGAKLGGLESRFLTVPPRHQGFLISTDGLQSGPPAASSDSAWSLVLATIADPPEEVGFAWAEFSDIVLIFTTDSGFEVRPLS